MIDDISKHYVKQSPQSTELSETGGSASSELHFEKLQLGSIFSIEDDGDKKIGIKDIRGKVSSSVVKLILPYIEQGKEWTQEIIDNIAKQIEKMDPTKVEKEKAQDTNNWIRVSPDCGITKWVKDNQICTVYKTLDGRISKYANGVTSVSSFEDTIEVIDVKYEAYEHPVGDLENSISQWTDTNGVTTVNSTKGKITTRTFMQDGKPTTYSLKLFRDKEKMDNILSVEYNNAGYLVAYTVADGEFNGEKVTNLRYNSYGKLVSYVDKTGKLVDSIFYGDTNGVFFDVPNRQGNVLNCTSLAGLFSLSVSDDAGIQDFLSNIVTHEKDSDIYTAKLPGRAPIQYTSEDIAKAKNMSNGDKDVRVFEMAYVQTVKKEKKLNLIPGSVASNGQYFSSFIETLTNQSSFHKEAPYFKAKICGYDTFHEELSLVDNSSKSFLNDLAKNNGKYILQLSFALTYAGQSAGTFEVTDIHGKKVRLYTCHAYSLTNVKKYKDDIILTLVNPHDTSEKIEINAKELKKSRPCPPVIDGAKTKSLSKVLTEGYKLK